MDQIVSFGTIIHTEVVKQRTL